MWYLKMVATESLVKQGSFDYSSIQRLPVLSVSATFYLNIYNILLLYIL